MANYYDNGVSIYPTVPSTQSNSKIIYNGLLPQNGAVEVYAYVGYGRTWGNSRYYRMTKETHGFEVSIPILHHADSLNICFKDGANNWDNNAGVNYSFIVNNPNTNCSLEFADEISPPNGKAISCHSSFERVKMAISHWLGLLD